MDELARIKISINTDTWDKQDLDSLLWEVLWEPLALPRHIREFFKLENPSIEFVAKQGDKIIGGLVAYWITPAEVELRHLAVHPSFQRMGIGKMLINQFRTTIKNVGGKRIRTNARNATVEF